MKSTGIVRNVDELGRIVLPIELRRSMHIAEKDPIEIYVEGNSIILRKHEESCAICGSSRGLTELRGKAVCAKCIKDIKAADFSNE